MGKIIKISVYQRQKREKQIKALLNPHYSPKNSKKLLINIKAHKYSALVDFIMQISRYFEALILVNLYNKNNLAVFPNKKQPMIKLVVY